MSHPRMKKSFLIASTIALSVGLVAASASAASAHEALASTNPGEGATVTELAAVELVFTAEILDTMNTGRTEVLGPDELHYETSCARIDGTVMTTDVQLGAAGEYRVLWRAVSGDGHPISSEYSFTYAPAGGATAVAGTAESVCGDDGRVIEPAPETTPTATELPSETPTVAADEGSDSAAAEDQGADVWPWVGATVGGVVVIAVIAWLVAARRKKKA